MSEMSPMRFPLRSEAQSPAQADETDALREADPAPLTFRCRRAVRALLADAGVADQIARGIRRRRAAGPLLPDCDPPAE